MLRFRQFSESAHTQLAKTNARQKDELERIKAKHDREDDRARTQDVARKNVQTEKAPDTSDAMKRYKAGKAGFTDVAHLKAKGLIPRADGTKRKSPKYEEVTFLDEKIKGLVNKAEKSGVSYSILKKVYDRGMAAYKTGHRPGTTAQQWAFARVNSFLTGGGARKSDADLWKKRKEEVELGEDDSEKIKKNESLWANIHKKRQRIKRGSGERMRKKGEKGAPTPAQMKRAKGESLNEWGEITEKAEYNGRPVDLNNPTRGDKKKYKVYVRNEKGNVVKVEFGDPNMEIKRDDPARRKSFRARHNCDNPGPKYKARYWSCKFWEKGKSVTDLMKG